MHLDYCQNKITYPATKPEQAIKSVVLKFSNLSKNEKTPIKGEYLNLLPFVSGVVIMSLDFREFDELKDNSLLLEVIPGTQVNS
jgi:hypothetical protein